MSDPKFVKLKQKVQDLHNQVQELAEQLMDYEVEFYNYIHKDVLSLIKDYTWKINDRNSLSLDISIKIKDMITSILSETGDRSEDDSEFYSASVNGTTFTVHFYDTCLIIKCYQLRDLIKSLKMKVIPCPKHLNYLRDQYDQAVDSINILCQL